MIIWKIIQKPYLVNTVKVKDILPSETVQRKFNGKRLAVFVMVGVKFYWR
jgi:hypothetical protein